MQNWASDHPQFTSAWNSAHPWAWSPAGVDAGTWATAAWAGAAWPAVNGWLGWGDDSSGYAYDYGQNITYQNGSVYYGSQPEGSTAEYYAEASNLASTAAAAPANNGQWLPLGVYGLVEKDSKTPSVTFQLAIDKAGIVRGNAIVAGSMTTQTVQGAVQKKTQRVCWTVGTNTSVVYDTGLDNLVKKEAPILVHNGPATTHQELLVRIKRPASGNGSVTSSN